MKFSVGITVLKQYEQLRECLQSVKASTMQPERIYVLDNGGECGELEGATVIRPGRNIGVAGAWNVLLRAIHPLPAIILNDDCAVRPDTFTQMLRQPEPSFVLGFGFACFRQDAFFSEKVGPYDEGFWPAYYEDADFKARMKQGGLRWTDLGNIVARHGNHGERPYQNFTKDELTLFGHQLESNKKRFIEKWGGLPSDLGV